MGEELEKKVKNVNRAGPFDFHPNALVREGVLIVSRAGTPELTTVKRSWNVSDWINYLFKGEEPSTTREITTYGNPVEVERIPGVSGYAIVEEKDKYWVEYDVSKK
jgi:hypothetical protein